VRDENIQTGLALVAFAPVPVESIRRASSALLEGIRCEGATWVEWSPLWFSDEAHDGKSCQRLLPCSVPL